MSRPKPVILLQSVDPKTYKAAQVLQSAAIFAVFLDDRPINLRTLHSVVDDGPKYKKCSFSNAGHAFNLRAKLNKQFNTDRFSVVMLSSGVTVEEDR